jgi:hypothetical protein
VGFDPYAINERGDRINKYNIQVTGVPLRLTNANLSASISFNGKGTINGNDGSKSGEGSGSSDASAYRGSITPCHGRVYPGRFPVLHESERALVGEFQL